MIWIICQHISLTVKDCNKSVNRHYSEGVISLRFSRKHWPPLLLEIPPNSRLELKSSKSKTKSSRLLSLKVMMTPIRVNRPSPPDPYLNWSGYLHHRCHLHSQVKYRFIVRLSTSKVYALNLPMALMDSPGKSGASSICASLFPSLRAWQKTKQE